MRVKTLILTVFVVAIGVMFQYTATTSSAQFRKTEPAKTVTSTAQIESVGFEPLVWSTVVNNSVMIPNGTRNFSSYGQPSVNSLGTVVFRGRSTQGTHETGMFLRRFGAPHVISLADLTMFVPEPNNLETKFREFSSFPRIAMNENFTAFRGQHAPVYRYLLPDGTETRAGTTGIYVNFGHDLLITGASKLGAVPGFNHYSVPMFKEHMFDVFPGGSAVTDAGAIVFKGNWTENELEHKTGIFARTLVNGPQGGFEMLTMLASSDTEIPNLPPTVKDRELVSLVFDSTSPPTAVDNHAVFLGLDNEEDPHYGGIYRVSIKGGPLEPLIEIGKPLPGTDSTNVIRIGEGLSWDGRYLAFWAAWGEQFKTVRTNCPVDGNRDLIAFCNGIDPKSIQDPETGEWYQLHQVPVEQGIVVYDLQTQLAWVVARNGAFADFLFWTYSGHVPGSDGDADAEPPRWRSAAFMAVSDGMVAFKARHAKKNAKNEYFAITDGIYLLDAPASGPLNTLFETGMDGTLLDPSLPPGTMPITGLGLERDGFRGRFLTINAAMANEEAGWGGIYLTTVRRAGPPTVVPTKTEVANPVNLPAIKNRRNNR